MACRSTAAPLGCPCNGTDFVPLLSDKPGRDGRGCYAGSNERPRSGKGGGNGMRRLIIGMTGSTRAIFGVRVPEALKGSEVETDLTASNRAQRPLAHDTRDTV